MHAKCTLFCLQAPLTTYLCRNMKCFVFLFITVGLAESFPLVFPTFRCKRQVESFPTHQRVGVKTRQKEEQKIPVVVRSVCAYALWEVPGCCCDDPFPPSDVQETFEAPQQKIVGALFLARACDPSVTLTHRNSVTRINVAQTGGGYHVTFEFSAGKVPIPGPKVMFKCPTVESYWRSNSSRPGTYLAKISDGKEKKNVTLDRVMECQSD